MKDSEINELQMSLIAESEDAVKTMRTASKVAKKGMAGQYRLCYGSSKLDLDKFNLSAFNRLTILLSYYDLLNPLR